MALTDMNFSERVRYVRARLGYSQHVLADELEVSCGSISRWENENRLPRLKSQARFYSLCAAYGIVFEDVPDYLLVDFISTREGRSGREDKRKARYKSQDEA